MSRRSARIEKKAEPNYTEDVKNEEAESPLQTNKNIFVKKEPTTDSLSENSETESESPKMSSFGMSRRSARIEKKFEPNYAEDVKNEEAESPLRKSKRKSVKIESTTDSLSENSETESESPKMSKRFFKSKSPAVNKGSSTSALKKNKENTGLSEYERQIQQNIEDRKKIFEELRLGEAKNLFSETIAQPKVRPTPVKRAYKRKVEQETEETSTRKSYRLRSRTSEEPTNLVALSDSATESVQKLVIKRTGPLTLSRTYTNQDAVEESTKFINDLVPLLEKEGELEKLPHDLQDFLKLMNTFDLSEAGVAKVAKNRIYSLAWHPGTCKMLVAAGDRAGTIGFWDIDQLDDVHQGVRTYDVHTAPVNCLTFDKFNPTRLLSTSYDGHVRCLDFHTNSFDEVYSVKIDKHNWTAFHAQKDPSTLLVSQSNGEVVVLDVRTKPAKAQTHIQCFAKSVRTLSLHPTDGNLFLACNRFGQMGMFDLRYTSPKHDGDEETVQPVMEFPKTSAKGIHGAFFSPITGNYALTTTLEHNIKIFDVKNNLSAQDRCIKTIPHNNFTGQWLTPFKAVWHPQREDIFLVGSLEKPRRIELYGAPSGQLLHNFKGEMLNSVCSINAFHPTVPILAGGNSSGRIHIFRP